MFNEDHLELDVRKRVYNCVRKSPGLHFREIQRRTNLATGSVDYHLHFLHKNGLVRTEKAGKFLRYYPTDISYGKEEKELLNLLRQETIRHIIIYIIDHKRVNATKIAEEIGISSSNLSRYLNMLLDKNIITQKKKGRFRFYSVPEKEKIISALITHKTSFLDKIVDRFISAWEE